MQVLFKSRDIEAVRMRGFARQRTQFVFRRMAWLVSKATVDLSDINGPRGGLDKRCRVQVLIPNANPLVVTSIAKDWRGALDLALARAVSSIARRRQARLARRRASQRELTGVFQPEAV
ncbi:HPF/RaiA family ribosome-associated protein [Paraburkholderia terrae]